MDKVKKGKITDFKFAAVKKTLEGKKYLTEDIWQEEAKPLHPFRKILRYKLRLLSIVINGLFSNNCEIRARALTYTTLFSMVPLLAFAFSILKGMGMVEKGVGRMRPLIETFIALDKKEEVFNKLIEFLEHINAGAIGGIGLLLLAYAVLSLLTTIEISFNKIWGIHSHRPFLQRVTLYWTVVTLSPILIMVSIGLTTSAQFQFILNLFDMIPFFSGIIKLLILFLMPLVFTCTAFTFLYYIIPNTRVKIHAAFAGGIVAGTIYKIAEISYIKYTAFVANFGTAGKIYGTLVAIPLFIFWIYIVWLIVLLGVEVAFAVQNMKNYMKERRTVDISYTENEKATFCVFLEILKRFYHQQTPLSSEEISELLHLPVRLVNDILHFLTENHIVSEAGANPARFTPAVLPENLKIFDFLSIMRDRGKTSFIREKDETGELVTRLYDGLRMQLRESLGDLSFHDYMRQLTAPITPTTKPDMKNLFQFWKKKLKGDE